MHVDKELIQEIQRILSSSNVLLYPHRNVVEWFGSWCRTFDALSTGSEKHSFKSCTHVPIWLQVAHASNRPHVACLLLEDLCEDASTLTLKQQIALYYLNAKEQNGKEENK